MPTLSMDAISDDHEDDEVGRTLDLPYTTLTLSRTQPYPNSNPRSTARRTSGDRGGPPGPETYRTTILPYFFANLALGRCRASAEHACACFCGYMRRGMWLTCAGACSGASRAGSPHTGSVFFLGLQWFQHDV